MSETEKPWRKLVAQILAMRDSGDFRTEISSLKKGGSGHSESYAVPYVAPYAQGYDTTALLRAAALIAQFPEISQTSQEIPQGIGTSFAQASRALKQKYGQDPTLDPKKPDAIGQRLATLEHLDLEAASSTLRSILALMKDTKVPVNFYDLTATLLHWGRGFTPESQTVRRRPLRDYYGAAFIETTDNQPAQTA